MTDLKIFNAPAGSGKSTEIKARVLEWSTLNPHDRMLCVTFTNRAANELQGGISAENVDVSTIHSFLAEFMKPVFVSPEAVRLYLELYREDIENRILNQERKPHIDQSNARYRENLGDQLTFDLIASSIKSLRYNEMSSNSLYTGGLSHEDLLSFANICAARFPGLLRRLGARYQQIIIDEYQDTNVDVLEFFVSAAEASSCSLHLYGDPMQQIYQMTSSRLRAILSKFKIDDRTVTNYRSSEAIVSALNKVYSNPAVIQKPNNKGVSAKPRFHLSSSPSDLRKQLTTPETLILSVRNATIFDNIGAKELLSAVQSMPAHSYISRYPALGVLTELDWRDVNNPLIRQLYGFLTLEEAYFQGKIGEVVQLIKQHPVVFGFLPVEGHLDKERLRGELEGFFAFLNSDSVTVRDVISQQVQQNRMSTGMAAEYFEDEDYSALLAVSFVQVRRMREFNLRPGWSTQHGVKGESHERVIFLAEDAPFPVSVQITKLLNFWPTTNVSLEVIEEVYVELTERFISARKEAAGYYDNPSKDTYSQHGETVTSAVKSVIDACSNLPFFEVLYGEKLRIYLQKLNTTTAKELFKLTPIEGILNAYRLFYVGCSRARAELDVIVDRSKISDIDDFSRTFKGLGFSVTDHL